MTENHFRSHFSPFQINTQLFLFIFFILEVRFGPFRMTENHFLAISDQYTILVFKMDASGHLGSPICAKNNRVLPLCAINGYAKYEVARWIYDTVRDATSFLSILLRHYRRTVGAARQIWLGIIAILVNFSYINIIETISITYQHDSG